MRKLAFCIWENKDADQLRGNHEADQRLCFRYTASTIPLLPKSKFQASSNLLWLYSPVCVGPGRKPRRPVFSQRGSYVLSLQAPEYFRMRITHIPVDPVTKKVNPYVTNGFRPGPTQTGLYSHRRWLEASNFGCR